MNRESSSATATVVVVLDGETDAGYQLARRLLAEGRRVAAVAHHPGDVVRIMHGHSADRVMVIVADTADLRQRSRVAEDTALRASA